MTALAQALPRPERRSAELAWDAALVLAGSLLVAGLAQLELHLGFTPVPITGQTLGVLLVGASLGSLRGGASLLLYLGWGAIGLPFFSGGDGGATFLGLSAATGGYLWGFVIAAAIVGFLAERGWDRRLSGAIGAMLIGNIVIYLAGVPWLIGAIDVPLQQGLELGLYPFIVGDVVKLLIAAAALPLAWRLVRPPS